MIRFVTFNIRCDYDQDGENSFRFRKKSILEKLGREKPDIVCFQEVRPHVAEWLKQELGEYYVLGCGRSKDFADEQMTLAYRRDRFDLLFWETFWLSATGKPGSRFQDQSPCPRTAAEAVLLDREDHNALYRVINTHLDHEGVEARRRGLQVILNRLAHTKHFPEAGLILAGDFNAEPDWPELSALWETGNITDASASLGGTFHDYGRIERYEKIDYVCIAPPLRAENARLWTDCTDGVYLSDHYPVCVDIFQEQPI